MTGPSSFATRRFNYNDFEIILEVDPEVPPRIIDHNQETMDMVNNATFIEIRSKSKKPYYGELDNIVKGLEDMLILATNLNVSHYDMQAMFEDFDRPDKTIQLDIFHKVRDPSYRHRIIGLSRMLFTYNDVSIRLEEFVENWFKSQTNIKEVYDLYFENLLNHKLSSRYRFINLAIALEFLHRITFDNRIQQIIPYIPEGQNKEWYRELSKYINNITLRTIILLFIKGDSMIRKFIGNTNDIELISKEIYRTRNYLIHLEPLPNDEILTSGKLDWLHKRMRIILEISILRHLGFSTESIKTIVFRNLRMQEMIHRLSGP